MFCWFIVGKTWWVWPTAITGSDRILIDLGAICHLHQWERFCNHYYQLLTSVLVWRPRLYSTSWTASLGEGNALCSSGLSSRHLYFPIAMYYAFFYVSLFLMFLLLSGLLSHLCGTIFLFQMLSLYKFFSFVVQQLFKSSSRTFLSSQTCDFHAWFSRLALQEGSNLECHWNFRASSFVLWKQTPSVAIMHNTSGLWFFKKMFKSS